MKTSVENVADLVKEKKIPGIRDIRDESDRHGMRVVFEIKRDENPEVILNRSSAPSATATTVCGDGWRWTIFRSEFRSNFHQLPRP